MSNERVMYTPSGKLVTHGGSGTAYANYGCRSDECRAANTERVERRRKERVATEGTFEHNASGYINWGCRCQVCVQDHADRCSRERKSRLSRPEDIPHGTTSGYTAWNCRCGDCKAASSEYYRSQRALKKQAAK